MRDYQAIIEAAGGKFLGIQDGNVWFSYPSHSTDLIKEAEFSAEVVMVKFEEDRQKDWLPVDHRPGCPGCIICGHGQFSEA